MLFILNRQNKYNNQRMVFSSFNGMEFQFTYPVLKAVGSLFVWIYQMTFWNLINKSNPKCGVCDARCVMTNRNRIEGASKCNTQYSEKKWKKKRRQQICPFHSMMLILTTADGFHTFIVWTMAHLHSMTNLIPSICFFFDWKSLILPFVFIFIFIKNRTCTAWHIVRYIYWVAERCEITQSDISSGRTKKKRTTESGKEEHEKTHK